MTESNLNPHLTDGYSDLNALAKGALRRFGDFSSGKLQSSAALMFVDFANMIIDILRAHPYWPKDVPLSYYKSETETRPIPDTVLQAGLLFYYASQQSSSKAPMYGQMFTRTMNEVLWYNMNGNTKIQMRIPDNASNPNYVAGKTSKINGLVTKPDE